MNKVAEKSCVVKSTYDGRIRYWLLPYPVDSYLGNNTIVIFVGDYKSCQSTIKRLRRY